MADIVLSIVIPTTGVLWGAIPIIASLLKRDIPVMVAAFE